MDAVDALHTAYSILHCFPPLHSPITLISRFMSWLGLSRHKAYLHPHLAEARYVQMPRSVSIKHMDQQWWQLDNRFFSRLTNPSLIYA